MGISALIIDDEPLARNIIKEYSRNIPALNISGECGDAVEASQYLQHHHIDLIFLDINMPKISGIDFLRNIVHPPMVILTTAYSEYALEGYELNIIDYLKKPFSFERFFRAYLKAEDYSQIRKNYTPDIEINNQKEFIFLKSDKRNIKINVSEICFIEGLGDYIKVYTTNQKFISNLSMKKITDCLPHDKFLRIHKSYIVAIDKIESLEGNLVKVNNSKIPVGNNYKTDLLNFIRNYSAE
jgi:DNA-binding LytR/AlgR family response regulator